MSASAAPAPDWSPFRVAGDDENRGRGDPPRSIDTPEGVGDRLRTAAFAEIQAREAFRWAAARFDDAPDGLPQAWRSLADSEDRHLAWLLARMAALDVPVAARRVSDFLWRSLVSCKTAREFAEYMASAEERGRLAGESFRRAMVARDPESAALFGRIAEEEVAHIALARRFFPGPPVSAFSALKT